MRFFVQKHRFPWPRKVICKIFRTKSLSESIPHAHLYGFSYKTISEPAWPRPYIRFFAQNLFHSPGVASKFSLALEIYCAIMIVEVMPFWGDFPQCAQTLI